MKKLLEILPILFVTLSLVLPFPASAETTAGINPCNFFYSFDLLVEKISLFFTWDPYEKAKKNILFSDERIAEIEAAKGDTKVELKAAKEYGKNVARAFEVLNDMKNKNQKEGFLISFANRYEKHWGTLVSTYNSLSDEEKSDFRSILYTYNDNLKKVVESLQGIVDSTSGENKTATSDNLSTQPETNAKSDDRKKTTLNEEPEQTDNTFVCNGETYLRCETVGQKSVCPISGKAYCQMTKEQQATQYKVEMSKCEDELNKKLQKASQKTKDLLDGKGDSSFDSILEDLNASSEPDSCRKARSLSGFDIPNSYPSPTYQQPHPTTDTYNIPDFLEKQGQESRLKELEMKQWQSEFEQQKIENNRSANCAMENGIYLNGVCKHLY